MNGTLLMAASAAQQTFLTLENDVTFAGSGAIVLDDTVNTGQAFFRSFNNIATNTTTIRGSGTLGGNALRMINNGMIHADVNGRTLAIDSTGGNGANSSIAVSGGDGLTPFVNNSTMRARNGGTLFFVDGRYFQSSAGVIEALAGSTVLIGGGARIVGGTLQGPGTLAGADVANPFLQNVTIASGATYRTGQGGTTFINSGITVNGTLLIAASAAQQTFLTLENDVTFAGSGAIVLDDTVNTGQAFFRSFNNIATNTTTIRGSGTLGGNALRMINNGTISGNVSGRSLLIDATGGSAGDGALAVTGGDGLATFVNNGTIVAQNNGRVDFAGGRYTNTGSFQSAGGTLAFGSDANLTNLLADRSLRGGSYTVNGANMELRGAAPAAAGIITIGGTGTATDTTVTLFGSGGRLFAGRSSGGSAISLEDTLTTVAQTGRLNLFTGRTFTSTNSVLNHGIVELENASFSPTSYTNSGETFGTGTISAATANSGLIRASGGTLSTREINGAGIIRSDASSTLNMSTATAASSAAQLINNGTLNLGTQNITVSGDYQNASFGSGNAFNRRANVTGTGQILAQSATQDVTGSLSLGNVRVGDVLTRTVTITNNGTASILRGAVQTINAPSAAITSNQDWVLNPNGGSVNVGVSIATGTAGSLAGQTVNIVNNFDNVAPTALAVTGGVFNAAVANITPNPIALGNTRVGGTLTGTVSIANTAPGGAFSEGLAVTSVTPSGVGVGAAPGLIAAGNAGTLAVNLNGQTGTAGAKSGTVQLGLASDGTGTSGLSQLGLTSQSVTVTGNVFQVANPVVNNASSFLNIGPVLVGTVVTRTLSIANPLIAPAGFQEGLDASWNTGSITGNAIADTTGSVTNLAAGATNATSMVLTFDTSSAGNKSGTVTINVASNGAGTSGLGLFALAGIPLTVTGSVETSTTVLNPAVATILNSQPIVVASQRVGGTNTAAVQVRNDGAPPSAGLDGSFASATGDATGAGSFTNMGTGGTSSAITVGVNSATAGAKSGTVTLDFASNLSPNPNVALPSQTVDVQGNVYQAAVARAVPTSINLGVTREGSTPLTANLVLHNDAPNIAGFSETLLTTVSSSTPSGPFFVNGGSSASNAPIAAGDNSAYGLSLAAGTAGQFSGSYAIANTSQAISGSGLSNLALDGQSITATGTVTDIAEFGLSWSGPGTLTGSLASGFTLDLGTFTAASGSSGGTLTVSNQVADSLFNELLDVAFDAASLGNGFTVNSAAISGLDGGQSAGRALGFSWTSGGLFTSSFSLSALSRFAGLQDLTLGNASISLRAFIDPTQPPPPPPPPTGVSEPGTLALLTAGLGGLLWLRRRRKAA